MMAMVMILSASDFECHMMMMMMLTQIRGFLSGHLSEVEHVAHHARFCQINFWRIVTLTIKSLSRKSHSHNTVILTHNAKNQHFFYWSVILVALTAQRNGIKWALFLVSLLHRNAPIQVLPLWILQAQIVLQCLFHHCDHQHHKWRPTSIVMIITSV